MEDIDNLDICLGEHFTFIFQNDEQLLSVLINFFSLGIKKNHMCILIGDWQLKQKVLSAFRNKGMELQRYLETNQFLFLSAEETYLSKGYFDPDTMIEKLKEVEQKALSDGYAGISVSGEASWLARNVRGSERFMEYESRLNKFFPLSKVCAICLYDERKLDKSILAESIHCHPEVLFYDKRCENLYYSDGSYEGGTKKCFPASSYELIKEDFTVNSKDNI